MKKRFLLAGLSFLFLAGTAFVVLKNTGHKKATTEKKYSLLPRKSSLSYTREWEAVKNNVAVLNKKIEKNNADIKSMLALAGIYMQESRVTGNYAYYNEAAMQQINSVLEKDPENFEALSFKTTILLSKHQFEEALVIGEQLKQ